MADIYVPNYMSFHNDNTFLGSYQGLRFKLTPNVEAQEIHAEYWYGPLCYDLSDMDGDRIFPMSDEGIADMTAWLVELARAKNETPA